MHNKDRMTDHQKQQACKDKTDHSQAIPPGSVRQKQNDRGCRKHSKTIEQFSNQTQQNKIYTHNEQLNKSTTGNSTSDTQQEGT